MGNRLEIVVVIGCLGAGAVVAVPHHVQLASEARTAEVVALTRGTTTAAQLAHSRWLAANQPATIEGVRGVVAMTQGYPSTATLPLMLGESETLRFQYEDGVWRHTDVRTDHPCGVSYQPPAAPGQNPAISAQTSGC